MQRRPGKYSDPLHEPAQLTEKQVRQAPRYRQGDTVKINMQFTWPVENSVKVYVHFNFHEAEEKSRSRWGRKPPVKPSLWRPLVHGSTRLSVEPDKNGTLDATVILKIPDDAHHGLYSTIRASLTANLAVNPATHRGNRDGRTESPFRKVHTACRCTRGLDHLAYA